MNTAQLPQLAELTDMFGTDLAGLLQMAVAAIITGFVMATCPRKLKLAGWIYMASMAGLFYLHAPAHYLNTGMIAGVVATVVFYPFRPKTKTA